MLTNEAVRVRSFVPPVRDEESETQRKAHAKRVRETRRSTQGVTLDEIKSAEQLVKKKTGNGTTEPPPSHKKNDENTPPPNTDNGPVSPVPGTVLREATDRLMWSCPYDSMARTLQNECFFGKI